MNLIWGGFWAFMWSAGVAAPPPPPPPPPQVLTGGGGVWPAPRPARRPAPEPQPARYAYVGLARFGLSVDARVGFSTQEERDRQRLDDLEANMIGLRKRVDDLEAMVLLVLSSI